MNIDCTTWMDGSLLGVIRVLGYSSRTTRPSNLHTGVDGHDTTYSTQRARHLKNTLYVYQRGYMVHAYGMDHRAIPPQTRAAWPLKILC